ncbi:DUF2785 domain-containing protein [Flexivirga sp. B27]
MDTATVERLAEDLASEDPAIRDERAYGQLASALSDGSLSRDQRHWLGEQMVERLSHSASHARSFAALILAVLASTWSSEDGPWPDRWTDAVLTWWPAEQDLRGYAEPVGWVHAVAHGADAVGTLGAVGLAPTGRLLAIIGERLTAPTDFVWRDQEDDRVAAAVVAILLGDGSAGLQPLLAPIAAMFATGQPGPVPPAASNSMHTLRSLYVALGNTVVHPETGEPVAISHAAELQRHIAATLQPTTPWLFSAAVGSVG